MSSDPAGVTAFVAGASGYTGRSVVQVLRERGVRTFAHVRPDSPRLADWQRRFAELEAAVDTTPWEEASLRVTLARIRPSLVFALLGTTARRSRRARMQGRNESYDAVDYGLSVLLLRAAIASGAHPRFVYLSAIGAAARTRSAYMAVRWRVEEEIRRSGLPWLIARPSFITGADRDESRPLERVGAALADAALLFGALFGGGALRARYRPVTGDVLARGLVALALRPDTAGRVVGTEHILGAAETPPPAPLP
jgi:uncharacterized protein YbjT (DUF2867 family)